MTTPSGETWVFRVELPSGVANGGRFVARLFEAFAAGLGREVRRHSGGSTMPWWGWGKKRRRDIWRRIVGTFESIGECSRRLGAEGDRLGIPAHFQVMTGRAPPPDLATHQPAAVGLSDAETTSDSSA